MTTANHDQVLDRRAITAALLAAFERRHEVLDIIVDSADRASAIAGIVDLLGIDETAAEAVLNLPFRRLTKAERKRIQSELDDLDNVLEWSVAERPYASGAHFRLRPFQDATADSDLFRTRSIERSEATGKAWTDDRIELERQAGLARIEDETAQWFVAEDLSGDEPVAVGLAFGELDGRDVTLGIWIDPTKRKTGWGTAALKQGRTELAAFFPGTTIVVRTPA